MDIANNKVAFTQLRNAVHKDLAAVASSTHLELKKTLFLVSLKPGTIAIAPTIAVNSTKGFVAIGYSTLKGGLAMGYFLLEPVYQNGGAPTSIKIVDTRHKLLKEVKLEYEISPTSSHDNAREIRIESVREIEPEKYEIDGSVLLGDGWHKFHFVFF